MMNVMHFKSSKERLDYLKGNFKEIVPKEAVEAPKVASKEVEPTQKPKRKPRKKKEKKDDAVQAE